MRKICTYIANFVFFCYNKYSFENCIEKSIGNLQDHVCVSEEVPLSGILSEGDRDRRWIELWRSAYSLRAEGAKRCVR